MCMGLEVPDSAWPVMTFHLPCVSHLDSQGGAILWVSLPNNLKHDTKEGLTVSQCSLSQKRRIQESATLCMFARFGTMIMGAQAFLSFCFHEELLRELPCSELVPHSRISFDKSVLCGAIVKSGENGDWRGCQSKIGIGYD